MDPNPHALSGACIPEFRFTAPEALAAEMAPRGLAFLYAVDTGFSHSTLVPQGEGMMRVASLEDRFLSTAELAQRHGELLEMNSISSSLSKERTQRRWSSSRSTNVSARCSHRRTALPTSERLHSALSNNLYVVLLEHLGRSTLSAASLRTESPCSACR